MNIFNHIIKNEEIIGIGPLHWHEKGLGPIYVHYSFQVLTKQTSIEIKSEVIEAYGSLDSKEKAILQGFNIDYWIVRNNVAKLLGEPEDYANPLIDEMKTHFEKLGESYWSLFNQLHPVIKRCKAKLEITASLENLSGEILSFKKKVLAIA